MKTFCERIKETGEKLARNKIDIVQMNVGYVCNLACKHCHVQAGPNRTEQMSAETMKACLKFISESKATTVDITGGSPEMNPHLPMLIEELRKISTVKRILVRTNMTLLGTDKYRHFVDLFKANKLELVGSLPCYGEENVNAQRGNGVFNSNIGVLKLLNSIGYGKEKTELVLDLVYNPGGAFLPGPQAELQAAYKEQLKKNYGIEFNHLFTITNAPCGRFKEDLKKSGQFAAYMNLLVDNYNKDNLKKVMCVSQINIGWDGAVYDCDFNQALGLRIGAPKTIAEFTPKELMSEILADDHCYCCTAGAGSSCQGSLD
ncbi:molybdenum cofactor biosynthesis protein A [Sporomusa ovata DSM 2662]|uniref:Radical SAM n=1 Tax=Sporomusa ovata TaxID=2378 RepID=A0A0U1KTU4_9FIRM|nr:arsenosugar biosynthesis radical SAM (seleno)protein ArsS [Sporomusa ovata]EQB26758.1 radical SAM domain-containing protein [Sporomusa ovata DSM 2662]CQR70852.1 Radical SAM [Sporomusa ovata]